MGKRVHRYSQTTRDANEETLLKLARQLGAEWHQGPPLDGWIAWRGVWTPTEIKDPKREGQESEYTPAQRRFLDFCVIHRMPIWVWRTEDDVLRNLNTVRR